MLGWLRVLISIHALLAESDPVSFFNTQFSQISIHALLAESDSSTVESCSVCSSNFYPRSPCGERHRTVNIQRPTAEFLSTLSLRRATHQGGTHHEKSRNISIHALLAESDRCEFDRHNRKIKFLSTLSLRRATASNQQEQQAQHDFYPRSPCGERPHIIRHTVDLHSISIHALLAESDTRRASRQQPAGISIHALLAESDHQSQAVSHQTEHFYPRSPCGERPLTQYLH